MNFLGVTLVLTAVACSLAILGWATYQYPLVAGAAVAATFLIFTIRGVLL
jgi:hypothetical protein